MLKNSGAGLQWQRVPSETTARARAREVVDAVNMGLRLSGLGPFEDLSNRERAMVMAIVIGLAKTEEIPCTCNGCPKHGRNTP